MAQAVWDNGTASGSASTSFPLPPGLSAGDTPAPSTADVASSGDTACMTERQALFAEVRKSVMEDVDRKVTEKMRELWPKASAMLKKVEQDGQQKNTHVLAELAQYKAKQDILQAEHDQLKIAIQTMVAQLNLLGGVFAGPAGVKAATPSVATTTNGTHGAASSSSANGDANNSSAASASSLQDSPSPTINTEFSAASFAGSFPPLPELPPFPFPAAPVSVATPLSLAEALGSETVSTPSVPVSLVGSLPQLQQKIFSFTLRKADGTDLGLNVSHHEEDKALRVESVRAEGAVEAWNRQCVGSTASDKAVLPGDRIISVNNITHDPKAMLEECRDKQLLKLTVVRGAEPPEASRGITATPTTLRADASEFVPGAGLDIETSAPAKETKQDEPTLDEPTTPKEAE